MPAGCITFKNCLFHDADFFFNVKQTFSVNEFESGGNKAHEGQEKKKREREHQGKILQKYKL